MVSDDKKRSRAHAGANALKARGTNTYPLRAIVDRVPHPTYAHVTLEELECGHLQHPRRDMIGQSHAARRRCQECAMGTQNW